MNATSEDDGLILTTVGWIHPSANRCLSCGHTKDDHEDPIADDGRIIRPLKHCACSLCVCMGYTSTEEEANE